MKGLVKKNSGGFLLTSIVVLFFTSCSSTQMLTGKVYVVGNEPFTYLAFEIDKATMLKISEKSPSYNELWKHQTELLEIVYKTVDGELYIKEFKVKKE